MKRINVIGVGLLLAAFAGCGNSTNNGNDMKGLPDGFIQNGCNMDSDCDDGNKCHTPRCNIVTHVCMNTETMCESTDPCNNSACDQSSGACVPQPTNDNGTCTTAGGLAGTCSSGTCVPIPTCWDGVNQVATLDCSESSDSNTNDPNGFFLGTNVVNSYPCAPNETSPEVGYQFVATNTGPVTIKLQITAAIDPGTGGGPDGGVADGGVADGGAADGGMLTDVDLDLIVLDGSCTAGATCMNPQLSPGVYQGITDGTGNETVTFTATSGHTYFVVVDGKNGATADYSILVEACGNCQPTPQTTITCGTSIAMGDTSKGMSALGTYMCTDSQGNTSTVNAPGNEQVFLFTQTQQVAQPVKATVTGASGAVTLLALPNDFNSQCDPTSCLGSATSSAGSASLTFTADSSFETTPYWIVVDTPTAGANATFGLQVDCLPFCSDTGDTLGCTSTGGPASAPGGANNGNFGSTNEVSAWGPNPSTAPCSGLANLSGPEYVYLFTTPNQPTTGGVSYTFTLGALTPQKRLGLVVLKAGSTAPVQCDPSIACATTSAPGGYVSTGPSAAGVNDGVPATVTVTPDAAGVQYYYIIVDGVNGDVSDFGLSLSSC